MCVSDHPGASRHPLLCQAVLSKLDRSVAGRGGQYWRFLFSFPLFQTTPALHLRIVLSKLVPCQNQLGRRIGHVRRNKRIVKPFP